MIGNRWAREVTGRRDVLAAAAGLGATLFLAGCGTQAAASGSTEGMPGTQGDAAAALATATPPAVAPVATTSVAIQNFAFSPPVIGVRVGQMVTWTNKDVEQHTATARDKTFNSDVLDTNTSYAFTFTKAGTYDYNCLIHPDMVGSVIVSAG